MLTSAQILLVLTLFSLLLFVSHGKESLEVNTTQNIEEGLRNMAAEYIPFKSEENFNLSKEKGENSNPKASNFSLLDSPNKSNGTTDFVPNLTTDFSRSTRPTPVFSESPPLIHGFVSRLPWNSSAANENSLSVSAPPNATSAVTSEKFTGSLADDDMDTDNSSLTVSIPPSAPTTVSVSTATPEPDGWLTTVSDGVAGFTPYQETTLQPTVQFTNDSKIFSNTSDPQEENRNTGVVFGAMLGAILGASLLTLVGYLLCGRRKTNSFSHRRLYDDRNEPVLRLDNAPEPYDVNLGNVSYYNPTMNDSSMPAGRENARDGIPMDDIPPVRTSV